MKPAEVMLKFLWNKTSKRNSVCGEPHIIEVLPAPSSLESVQRSRQKTSTSSSTSVAANDNNISLPSQLSASTSLEENRFIDVCVRRTKNQNQNGDRCFRGLPDKYARKNKSESQLNYLIDEPAKYYNSPKVVSRFQQPCHNSGRSRSRSVFANIQQGSSEMPSAAEMDGTPRMYKKNPLISNKMPVHSVLPNVGHDGSTAGSGIVDYRGSQWSFCEDGTANPVPPPRKRRNKPQESSSETSSQSSTGPVEISKLTARKDRADECEPSQSDRVSTVRVHEDPLEFSLDLPPGFSDLGLDLLAFEFSAEDFISELKPKTENDETPEETPEQRVAIKQQGLLELKSTRNHEIISTHADLNHSSVSLSYSKMKHVTCNNDKLPRKTKLRSETIVKSIFARGKKCHDGVLYSEPADIGEKSASSFVHANTEREKHCDQNHLVLQKHVPEFQESAENGFKKISDYQDTLIERRIEKRPPGYHEGPTEVLVYAPISDETDWTVAFCSSGRTERNCGNGTQPDVLIGTDQKILSSSLSSLSSDSDQSFDAGQENDKAVEDCRLPVQEDLGHDLVVFHQLQGLLSKTVIKIGEISTSQDVIEQILCQEKLPANWHLYTLCKETLDPNVINNVFVELDSRDCPLKHLRQKDNSRNVRFQLHQKERIQIRVTCDAVPEGPKILKLAISCEETCRNVLDVSTQKFGLKSAAKFCLIQVDRNAKDCPMKRVQESQIIARLQTDYFLLCETEFLADTSDIYNQSFESSPRIKYRSRSAYSSGSSATVELDRLERKVASLKTKLVECEKLYQQRLKKQQNQLDCYRAIAFCTDPTTKVMLLEAELRSLTRVMQDQDRQLEMHRDLSKMSGHSEKERKKIEDKLAAMEESLSAIEKERTELCTCLQVTRTEEHKRSETSVPKNAAPPLYSICHEYQGNCLYSFELDRSNLVGQEYLPCKKDMNHDGSVQNNSGINLMEGDRILEINGEPVHHLNEKQMLSVVREMTENLHVVVLREETSDNDIYIL